MGCFSFMCQSTGKAVLSNSSSGNKVTLFLLQNGKVLEYMHGNYDSYGRVFSKKTDDEFQKSFEWDMDWGDVCELMFDNNPKSGIAADMNWSEGDPFPEYASPQDPNQGWGEDGEWLGNSSSNAFEWVENPYHKVLSKPEVTLVSPEFEKLHTSLIELEKQLQTLIDKYENNS